MRRFLSNWILENLYSFFHITGTAAQDWIEYNGHEYYFQTESEDDDFHAARDFCQQNFGELASILDQNEQDFIAGNVSLETKIQPEKRRKWKWKRYRLQINSYRESNLMFTLSSEKRLKKKSISRSLSHLLSSSVNEP